MHPNLFLKSHWQPKLEPQVFVIMPFSQKFEQRFNNVFIEAIENGNLRYQGVKLQAYKVNQQNTGDCLHTKILDGIAHSVLVLADISTIHRTKKNIICVPRFKNFSEWTRTLSIIYLQHYIFSSNFTQDNCSLFCLIPCWSFI